MATATSVYCTQHFALFPAPLHIRKKPRRLLFRRLAQRRPEQSPSCSGSLHGPLDDIIDEITGDIWRSPLEYSYDPSFLEWPASIKAAILWSAAPLPMSRNPSNQPLRVRKNRTSRSTASGSAVSEAMFSSSQDSSKGENAENAENEVDGDGPRLSSSSSAASQSPGVAESPDIAVIASCTPAEQQLSTILENLDGIPLSSDRRPSLRKRFFSLSSSMGKLRLRTSSIDETQEHASSMTTSPNTQSRTPSLMSQSDKDIGEYADTVAPCAEAVAAWIARNARRASVIGSVYSQAAEQHPSPLEFREELPTISDTVSAAIRPASLLTAAVRIFPEVKILKTAEQQTFWVAIEVEGVQHNRRMLSDSSVDVVFLVDNGYYVTRDCLNRALDLAVAAVHDLTKTDRIALYTTHCTHEIVTGTAPDIWFPLSPADKIGIEIFREMASDVRNLGTQTWKWPRPNPPMSELLIAVAKSLDCKGAKQGRTHIISLSPAVKDLHEVSRPYPLIHVHQINPAVVPFHNDQDPKNKICLDRCCTKVTVDNWGNYQPVADRIRQIVRHSRSEQPLGTVCNVHIDLSRGPGCEVLRYEGTRDITHLRLGQVHTIFAEIKVLRSQTGEMDTKSDDPVRDSMLTANNLRQDLQNAKEMGASKVHLLSVQVMHQSTALPATHWSFFETPLFIVKELGRLTPPTDRALELYKRRFFYAFSHLGAHFTNAEVEALENIVKPELKEQAKKILDRMMKEVEAHKAIVQYEKTNRQNLPLHVGPIDVPYPHPFLVEKLEARKKKRMGMFTK